MTTLPKLAEKAIKTRVGDKSFARGKSYFTGDRVFDTRRQGLTIKARCEGTAPEPYRLEVTFGKGDAIAAAECSCPVGDGGYCKHVAAMLLTWGARPEAFVEVEGVEASLERRSKPELIALVKQMLRREPDLETLLETPLPGSGKGKGRRTPVSPDTYKRQAAQAFRGHGWDSYNDYGYGAPDLTPVLEIGDGFLALDDLASASAVYEGLLAAIAEHYETVDDSDGEVSGVASEGVNGLVKCLAGLKAKDAARREAVLRALFEAFAFTRDYGGDGGEDIPEAIAEHATPGERRTVAGWVRDALSKVSGDAYSSKYRREAYANFLVAIEKDTLGTEDLIRIFRDERMSVELVDVLLARGRADEAVKALEQADPGELLRAAGVFVSRKQGAAAERVVEARADKLPGHQARQALEWLKARAAARKDAAAVRSLAEALFRDAPSFAGYKELRGLAKKAKGDWEKLGPALRESLRSTRPSDLILAYLDEGEVDAALDALAPKPGPGKSPAPYLAGSVAHLRLDVAKAAEKVRPRAALEIYRETAEREVDARSREHYKEACRHLKKVKSLHAALGEPSEWAYYVGVLRERHRTLRAFLEELKAAGL